MWSGKLCLSAASEEPVVLCIRKIETATMTARMTSSVCHAANRLLRYASRGPQAPVALVAIVLLAASLQLVQHLLCGFGLRQIRIHLQRRIERLLPAFLIAHLKK